MRRFVFTALLAHLGLLAGCNSSTPWFSYEVPPAEAGVYVAVYAVPAAFFLYLLTLAADDGPSSGPHRHQVRPGFVVGSVAWALFLGWMLTPWRGLGGPALSLLIFVVTLTFSTLFVDVRRAPQNVYTPRPQPESDAGEVFLRQVADQLAADRARVAQKRSSNARKEATLNQLLGGHDDVD